MEAKEKLEISYEMLKDHSEVASIFAQFGVEPPAEMLSKIIVARNAEQRVVGLLALQFLLHSEPIWIDPEFREQVEWRKFLELAADVAVGSDVYAFAESAKVEAILERAGYEKLPYHVWSRRF